MIRINRKIIVSVLFGCVFIGELYFLCPKQTYMLWKEVLVPFITPITILFTALVGKDIFKSEKSFQIRDEMLSLMNKIFDDLEMLRMNVINLIKNKITEKKFYEEVVSVHNIIKNLIDRSIRTGHWLTNEEKMLIERFNWKALKIDTIFHKSIGAFGKSKNGIFLLVDTEDETHVDSLLGELTVIIQSFESEFKKTLNKKAILIDN